MLVLGGLGLCGSLVVPPLSCILHVQVVWARSKAVVAAVWCSFYSHCLLSVDFVRYKGAHVTITETKTYNNTVAAH